MSCSGTTYTEHLDVWWERCDKMSVATSGPEAVPDIFQMKELKA